ncbi:hypothetical protein VN97_g13100 [Penicillium thymicola]|uniref:Uncharacterized protein n=1 Tax=Penicillium thymicola TaxID=293382 RepID=A0AAI9T5A3_PENTH|nr:hypothetical protein VN97_g13100 [Penicillium thymicola]
MEERANNGLIVPGVMERAAAQASISQGPRPTDNSSHTHHGGQLDGSGPIDQANSSPPSNSSVVESVERDDTPMHDAGSSRSAQGTAEPHDPELLATLDSPNDDEENDAIVDGWGNLRGSTFVILQYGPRHGARYKLKYRHGYTNDHMNHISQDLRISQIKVSPGSKVWRYTKDNVVGIYGVVSEEKKSGKSDPCTWLKIKWKDLRSEDTEKMQHSCSWIPRSDFKRFCNGKRAADAKIKEVWEEQEKRYHRVLQSDAGRRTEDRSPTPFPLGSAARPSPERQVSSRLSAPAIQISSPRQHEVPPSSTAHFYTGHGSPASPINLDVGEASHTSASSGASLNSNTSAMQNKSDGAIGQRAIRTEAEFIAEWKEKKGWDNLNDIQREACLTVAQAMYDLYKDTIAGNNQSQDSVDSPIGQRPGAVIAAH